MAILNLSPSPYLLTAKSPASFVLPSGEAVHLLVHKLNFHAEQIEETLRSVLDGRMNPEQGLADLGWIGTALKTSILSANAARKQFKDSKKGISQKKGNETELGKIVLSKYYKEKIKTIGERLFEVGRMIKNQQKKVPNKPIVVSSPHSLAPILDPYGLLNAELSGSLPLVPSVPISLPVSIALPLKVPQEIPLNDPFYCDQEKRLCWDAGKFSTSQKRQWSRAQFDRKSQVANMHCIYNPAKRRMEPSLFLGLSQTWDGVSQEMRTLQIKDKPPVQIESEEQVLPSGTKVGVSFCQGARDSMEDEHLASPLSIKLPDGTPVECEIFGIFDGHGGRASAQFAKNHLLEIFSQSLCRMNPNGLTDIGIRNCLKESFVLLDQSMKRGAFKPSFVGLKDNGYMKAIFNNDEILLEKFDTWFRSIDKSKIESEEQLIDLIRKWSSENHKGLLNIKREGILDLVFEASGTTAIVCFRINGKLWIANVGDSRAILRNGDTIFQLSSDAKLTRASGEPKPINKDKRFDYTTSVEKRGGKVLRLGKNGLRIEGELAPARALNDRALLGGTASDPKYVVVPRPKVLCMDPKLLDLSRPIKLFCGCDGVWDCATTDEVASVLGLDQEPTILANQIARAALVSTNIGGDPYSTDNVTSMVVEIPPSSEKPSM
jgi:serine/threonine protein phosphatase PrpC